MEVGSHSTFQLRRRRILAAAAGTVAWLSGLSAIRPSDAQSTRSAGRLPNPAASRTLEFFGPSERSFVDAAVDRLIPPDALGPGAVEAGVTVFIDHQLAGPYG
ncbi:MAG: gluconate 2-dehydrogenase subunit 3 family protein, partial [Gemmatimonadota bacterium]|nr:gluconate 2-dehydrogenase subunit 3 family protein [Gemmatimonadota bacterium]